MTIQDAISQLRTHADDWDVTFQPPCDGSYLEAWTEQFAARLGVRVPGDYLRLVSLTNGLWTRRGSLMSAQHCLEWNYIRWCCDQRWEEIPGGSQVIYEPLAVPEVPSYLWLGSYDSLDEYIYHIATAEFRAVWLADHDQVVFASRHLGDLLLFIATEGANVGD